MKSAWLPQRAFYWAASRLRRSPAVWTRKKPHLGFRCAWCAAPIRSQPPQALCSDDCADRMVHWLESRPLGGLRRR